MKKLSVVVAALVIAGTVSSWAATNTFTVTSFRGTITKADGSKVPVKGTQVTSNTVILVVSDNEPGHIVRIAKVVSATTTNTLISRFDSAFTAGGKFNADMEGSFTPDNTNVPAMSGDLQFTGKVSPSTSPKTVSGTLQGVWHDESPDSTFKGTISGKK